MTNKPPKPKKTEDWRDKEPSASDTKNFKRAMALWLINTAREDDFPRPTVCLYKKVLETELAKIDKRWAKIRSIKFT